jgi:hypothetical protein
VSVLRNTFSWSLSRRRTFQRCKRWYWFSYYGGWGGWEDGADGRTRRIWALKKLTSRPQWVGLIVHRVIAYTLRLLQEGRPPLDPADAVEQAIRRMRADYKESLSNRFQEDPKRHHRFFEHEYGEDVSEEQWAASADKVRRSLSNFFDSELFHHLQGLPAGDWLEVEDERDPPASLTVDEMPLLVRVDLAFRDDEIVNIVDWKTGKGGDPDIRDQLACYALYAADRWKVPAHRVQAREANVFLPREEVHPLDGGFVEEFRVGLRRSVAEMRAFLEDVAGNVPFPEGDFPFVAEERECRWCPFRAVCPRFGG